MNQEEIKETIIHIGKIMDSKGWLASNEGNMSVLLNENEIICTPTGIHKGWLEKEQLVIIDRKGTVIEGQYKPTAEILMHIGIYDRRDDVKAVIHTHSPYATAFAIIEQPIDKPIFPSQIKQLGEIPVAKYATPNTPQLMENLAPHLAKGCKAILLANHGNVVVGPDIMRAFYDMEKLEMLAKTLYIAKQIGTPRRLTEEEIAELKKGLHR